MLVYQCSDDFPKELLNNTAFRCYASNMPPEIRGCAGLTPIIVGWAIGGKVLSLIHI